MKWSWRIKADHDPEVASPTTAAPPATPPRVASPSMPLSVEPQSPPNEPRSAGRTSVAIKGVAVEPWSSQLHWQNVVGEAAYASAFKKLMVDYGKKFAADDYNWVELADPRAALVREPENRYDSNAVAVWIDDRRLVGYLPRDVAAIYADRLDALGPGHFLRVKSSVRIGRGWDDDVPVRGSVAVMLPAPEGVIAYNDLPDGPHVVLPPGKVIQVTGEEHHMDVLEKFNLGSTERHVAATLHVVTEQKTERSQPVDVVEVRLDGERVGVLTKAVSEQLRDLVAYVASRDKAPVCRAVIKGTRLRADVALYVARTVDVPNKWLDSVG